MFKCKSQRWYFNISHQLGFLLVYRFVGKVKVESFVFTRSLDFYQIDIQLLIDIYVLRFFIIQIYGVNTLLLIFIFYFNSILFHSKFKLKISVIKLKLLFNNLNFFYFQDISSYFGYIYPIASQAMYKRKQQNQHKSIILYDIFLFYVFFKHIFANLHNQDNFRVDFIIIIHAKDFCVFYDVSFYFYGVFQQDFIVEIRDAFSFFMNDAFNVCFKLIILVQIQKDQTIVHQAQDQMELLQSFIQFFKFIYHHFISVSELVLRLGKVTQKQFILCQIFNFMVLELVSGKEQGLVQQQV